MSALAEFQDALRIERLRRRIRQVALARQLGVSNVTLCGWESGSVPTDEHLRQWAAALDVAVPDGVRGSRLSPCGTTGGYQRHMHYRTVVCQPCREAQREYMRDYRKARSTL